VSATLAPKKAKEVSTPWLSPFRYMIGSPQNACSFVLD